MCFVLLPTQGDADLHLFWVEKKENKHFPQGILKKGEKMKMNTFSGHEFVAKREADGPVVNVLKMEYGQDEYAVDGRQEL